MSYEHNNDLSNGLSNEQIKREELNSIIASAEKDKYFSPRHRRTLIKMATSVVSKRMQVQDEAVFFYNTDEKGAIKTRSYPEFTKKTSMFEEVLQFYRHRGHTNIVHITDDGSATIDVPNVLRINASGWSPEDVDAQLTQLPEHSVLVITVTPTIPWAKISTHTSKYRLEPILDCRGDVSNVDFSFIDEPPFLLYDAPVVVSGQPSVLHCICVHYFDFFCPDNGLMEYSEKFFHSLTEMRAEGANLTYDTLLRMAAFVKASLPDVEASLPEEQTN